MGVAKVLCLCGFLFFEGVRDQMYVDVDFSLCIFCSRSVIFLWVLVSWKV
jgi:hypothetical protein